MNELVVIPHQQSTGLYVVHRDNPENPMKWIMPEAVWAPWGFDLVKAWYFVPGARWLPLRGGGVALDHRLPGVGRFRVEVTVDGERLASHLTVWNERSWAVRDVTSCPCWEFRNAPAFYGPDPGVEALSRAWIRSGGAPARLADTDRSRSLDGVLPVYAVRGAAGPEGWRERVADGYGWGLAGAESDSPLIALESADGRWVTATSWQGAYSLSFNTRPPFHGCIHSLPCLGTIAPGGLAEARGSSWLARGSARELFDRVASA